MATTLVRRAHLSLLLGTFAAASFGGLLLLVSLAQPHGDESRHAYRPADFPAAYLATALEGLPEPGPVGSRAKTVVIVPGFKLDKDTFPCSQCHDGKDLKTNPEPRALRDPHESRSVKHGGLWCLSCHDATNYDKLHLASGAQLDIADPLALCAQCHGQKAEDWKNGAHGLRTGYWDGPQRVLLCVACHDPHQPHFKTCEALPPPVRPSFVRPETPKEKP